jgi:hypothetical protein
LASHSGSDIAARDSRLVKGGFLGGNVSASEVKMAMQKKVVYFIGAGLSAPLGLPVVKNFREKSEDLYHENPESCGYFEEVLKIKDILIAAKYFNADADNIEEILSILEMSAQLEGTHLNESFRKYIADVIRHYTPPISPDPVGHISNWDEVTSEYEWTWRYYKRFVASLHNLTIKECVNPETHKKTFRWDRTSNPKTRYDVISLNYDLVLERACEFLDSRCDGEYPLRFQRAESDASPAEPGKPWLVKLHGSVDSDDIIPPTWSKALTPSLREQWRVAQGLLAEANHIRVLGYSLPASDAYVKYLFKSSVIYGQIELLGSLKSFDVITLDLDSKTQERYEGFVNPEYLRFADAKIEEYLSFIQPNKLYGPGSTEHIHFTTLEEAHQDFMENHADSS